MHCLGDALSARLAQVIRLTVLKSGRGEVDSPLQHRAERVSTTSTIALARWLAGESPVAARDAGAETWLF